MADFDRLYCALAGQLERMVRSEVPACDAVVEDACQIAWLQLLGHADSVRRTTALSWLATTAIHEAHRLVRRADRDLPLEEVIVPTVAPGPEESVEFRERLASLRRLPERQQRMLWLRGLGLSYADIAACTGCTHRTVERQVLRAQRTMRAAA